MHTIIGAHSTPAASAGPSCRWLRTIGRSEGYDCRVMPDIRFDIRTMRMRYRAATGTKGPLEDPAGAWLKYGWHSVPPVGAYGIGTWEEDLLERLHLGLVDAFSQWRLRVGFVDITIHGANASGGKLVGLPLEALIDDKFRANSPLILSLPWTQTHRRKEWAIARGIGMAIGPAWREFEESVSVSPAATWYPLFSAWPLPPQAPPTPNMPYPVKQLKHDLASMQAGRLKASMQQSISAAGVTDISLSNMNSLLDVLAIGVEQAVRGWVASQLVTEVFGFGPVPARNTPVRGGKTLPGNHLKA